MTVAINQPQPQKSPLEAIAQAVQAVRNIYGINADTTAIEKVKQEMEIQKKEADRKSSGVLTPEDFIKNSGNITLAKAGDKGALPFNVQTGSGVQSVHIVPGGLEQLTKQLEYQTKLKALEEKQNPKPTADQGNMALFAKRMEQAEDVFRDLEAGGFDPTSIGAGIQRLDVGLLSFPERFKSENVKRQAQAERNFVNAVLRKESGAAISPSEFKSAEQQYFPRGGDSEAVLQQKAENRKLATDSLRALSGPGYASIKSDGLTGYVSAKKPSGLTDFVRSKKSGVVPSANAAQTGISPEEARQELIRRRGISYGLPGAGKR